MKKALLFASLLFLLFCLFCACDRTDKSSGDGNENDDITTASSESQSALGGTELVFAGAVQTDTEEYGSVVYCKLKYDKKVISFSDYVKTNESSKWSVSLDVYGRLGIPSRTADLSVGDNLFYILVTDSHGRTKQYTVLVERAERIWWTVSFFGGNGVFYQKPIDDGKCVSEPAAVPTKNGYRFVKWDYDFSQPVTSDTDIFPIWEKCCQIHVGYILQGGQEIERNDCLEATVKNGTAVEDILATDMLNQNGKIGNILFDTGVSTVKEAEKYLQKSIHNSISISFSHYLIRGCFTDGNDEKCVDRVTDGKEKLNCFDGELYLVFEVQLPEEYECKVNVYFLYYFPDMIVCSPSMREITVAKTTKADRILQLPEVSLALGDDVKDFLFEWIEEYDVDDCGIARIDCQEIMIAQSFYRDITDPFNTGDCPVDGDFEIVAPFNAFIFVFNVTQRDGENGEMCPECDGIMYWRLDRWECLSCGYMSKSYNSEDEM